MKNNSTMGRKILKNKEIQSEESNMKETFQF